jgi:hypothetical protein
MSWVFPAESHSLGGFHGYELVISGGIPFLSGGCLVPGLVLTGRITINHSSGVFLVHDEVISCRITIFLLE